MRNRLLLPAAPVLACLVLAAPAAAATPEALSENWSGYEATTGSSDGFSAASGSWTQPRATCTAGSAYSASGDQTYSAFWVGLGGGGASTAASAALEQIGTQADCTASGNATYYAWYELVPSSPVKLDLKIAAGDRIYARVAVHGTSVTLSLSDQTTGQSVTKDLSMTNPAPDTSTAEWIAEAPSACAGGAEGQCSPLPLTDFGTVSFSHAYATAGGHTAAAGQWSTEAVALQGDTGGASPGSLSSDGAAFDVTYGAAGSSSSYSSYAYVPTYSYGYGGGGSGGYGYVDPSSGYGGYGYGYVYGGGYPGYGGYAYGGGY